jgi:hypothetical protein
VSLPELPAVPRDRRRTATVVAVGVLAALCLLGLVLGLRGLLAPADSGPASASPPPAGATPAPGTSATTASASTSSPASPTPSATATPDLLAGARAFSSPSGNIRCAISSKAARCDIVKKDWTAPAQPASCTAGWGDALMVSAGGAGIACADGRLAGGKALRYGRSITRGPVRCTSTKDGVTCVHRPSGHSFTVARASYEVH